jgi:hypothetical protein
MALLATIQAVMIQMLADTRESSVTCETTRMVAYWGLIINASGSASAVLLVNLQSTLTSDSRRMLLADDTTQEMPARMFHEGLRAEDLRKEKEGEILIGFGMNGLQMILFYHFFLSFVAGLLLFFLTITLWIVIRESERVLLACAPAIIIGIVPLLTRLCIPFRS